MEMDAGRPPLPPAELERRWALVAAHRDRLLRIALPRVGDAAEAEDVVHEAMLRCVAYDGLDETRISSLLTTLTRHLCVDQHRRRGRELRAGTAVLHGQLAEPGPEEVACDRDEAVWATRVAASLPVRQWEVLTLRARGANVAETARATHLSYKAVESALSRARSVVRARLAATLGALVCLARRGRTAAAPMTAVTLAGIAAVVVAGGSPVPPGARDGGDGAAPRVAVPAAGLDVRPPAGAAGPRGGSPIIAAAPVAPARTEHDPPPDGWETVEVPAPVAGPVEVSHGPTGDSVDRFAERCATSFGATITESGHVQAECRKRPGEPGAYPISDLLGR